MHKHAFYSALDVYKLDIAHLAHLLQLLLARHSTRLQNPQSAIAHNRNNACLLLFVSIPLYRAPFSVPKTPGHIIPLPTPFVGVQGTICLRATTD